MKKIIFALLIFLFQNIITSCLWCQLEEEPIILQNTDVSIVHEKNSYSIDEEIELCFSSILDYSYYSKYSFSIFLKEFNASEKRYETTEKLICYDSESGKEIKNFEYDETNGSKVEKSFLIKGIDSGKFACHIEGFGYHFNKYGGKSPGIKYEKWLYIDIAE